MASYILPGIYAELGIEFRKIKRTEEGSAKTFFIQATTVYPARVLLAELAKAFLASLARFSHIFLSTLTINIHFYSPSVREGLT